jgi:transcriptional regulator with XRE-family HTH domain
MVSLKEARMNQHLTQQELAAAAGVALSTVHRVERGKVRPRRSVIRRISSVLRLAPGEIDEFRAALDVVRRRDGARRRGD